MSPLLLLVLALILSASVSALLVRTSAHAAQGFMDQPGGRKVHDHPIPRTGGIAVFVGALAPMLGQLGQDRLLSGFAAGALVLVVFGLIDDYRGLDYRLKFLGQVLACAALILVSGLGIHTLGELWPGTTADLGVFWPVGTLLFRSHGHQRRELQRRARRPGRRHQPAHPGLRGPAGLFRGAVHGAGP